MSQPKTAKIKENTTKIVKPLDENSLLNDSINLDYSLSLNNVNKCDIYVFFYLFPKFPLSFIGSKAVINTQSWLLMGAGRVLSTLSLEEEEEERFSCSILDTVS